MLAIWKNLLGHFFVGVKILCSLNKKVSVHVGLGLRGNRIYSMANYFQILL